jgi:hypothetical protein
MSALAGHEIRRTDMRSFQALKNVCIAFYPARNFANLLQVVQMSGKKFHRLTISLPRN